jgi:hypothetical protein
MSLSLGNILGWADLDHPENATLMNFPRLVFALSLVILLLAAFIGDFLRGKIHALNDVERDDCGVVQSATLTLLASSHSFLLLTLTAHMAAPFA